MTTCIAISSQVLPLEELKALVRLPVHHEMAMGQIRRAGASPAKSNVIAFFLDGDRIERYMAGENEEEIEAVFATIASHKDRFDFATIQIRSDGFAPGSSLFLSQSFLAKIALFGIEVELLF